MYCPKCGMDNVNDAKFCRACGTDISALSMVLTGQITAASLTEQLEASKSKSPKSRKKKERVPTWEEAMSTFFVGVAFLVVFLLGLLFMRRAVIVWGWFIIPALACIGSGLGTMMQLKQQNTHQAELDQPQPLSFISSRQHMAEFPSAQRNTTEFITPPTSVTEHTTKHLVTEATGKTFDQTKEDELKIKGESDYRN